MGTSRKGREGGPHPLRRDGRSRHRARVFRSERKDRAGGEELRARPRGGAESQAVGGWGGLRELGKVCRLSPQRRGCPPGSWGPGALPTGGRRLWRPGEGQGLTNAAPSAFPGLSLPFPSRLVSRVHLADL